LRKSRVPRSHGALSAVLNEAHDSRFMDLGGQTPPLVGWAAKNYLYSAAAAAMGSQMPIEASGYVDLRARIQGKGKERERGLFGSGR
jgi:hypothetical protein